MNASNRQRRALNELEDAAPNVPGVQAPSGGGENVDKLFYGARTHLQQAQKQLHDLLELLQNGHQGVDSAPVADCYKATAESIDTMDQLAKKWQEEAQKSNAPKPGALNAGRQRHGLTLAECLLLLKRGPEITDFEARPYVENKVFFEKPKSLDDIQREMKFNFDRFLGDDE